MSTANLLEAQPMPGSGELFETLLECRNVTIERIQSPPQTHSGPCLQEQDEWVCLLQGEALLEMHGRHITLKTGESLLIPGGTPHQVLRTSREPLCIWLAVHIR